jgi:hypothetical protein
VLVAAALLAISLAHACLVVRDDFQGAGGINTSKRRLLRRGHVIPRSAGSIQQLAGNFLLRESADFTQCEGNLHQRIDGGMATGKYRTEAILFNRLGSSSRVGLGKLLLPDCHISLKITKSASASQGVKGFEPSCGDEP